VQRPVDDVEGSGVTRAGIREDALGVGLAGKREWQKTPS
jgi:hypothetical protein